MKKILLLATAGLSASIVFAQEQRVPLLENFSASTCPPCRPGNIHFEGQMSSVPEGEYVKIKYQWYFPGTGDPYCTEESKARTASYGINGVPNLVVDGTYYNDHPNGYTTSTFQSAKAVPATYKLSGGYSVDTTTKEVNVSVNYTPLEAGTNPRLFVAIIENKTTQNARTNGETEFHNIMKKMLPDNLGTDISSTAVNQQGTTNLTFTFKGDYRLPSGSAGQFAGDMIDHDIEHSVEEFSDLRVVAWVQGSDKKVYQAANLTAGALSINDISKSVKGVNVYPNPTKGDVNISLDMEEADEVSAMLVSVSGRVLKNQTTKFNKGQNVITFDTQELAAGIYNIIVMDSKNNSFSRQLAITK